MCSLAFPLLCLGFCKFAVRSCFDAPPFSNILFANLNNIPKCSETICNMKCGTQWLQSDWNNQDLNLKNKLQPPILNILEPKKFLQSRCYTQPNFDKLYHILLFSTVPLLFPNSSICHTSFLPHRCVTFTVQYIFTGKIKSFLYESLQLGIGVNDFPMQISQWVQVGNIYSPCLPTKYSALIAYMHAFTLCLHWKIPTCNYEFN